MFGAFRIKVLFAASLTGRASIGLLRPNQTSFVPGALPPAGRGACCGCHGCHCAAVCGCGTLLASARHMHTDAPLPPPSVPTSDDTATERFHFITGAPLSVKLEAALRAQCADAVARFAGSTVWSTRAQARFAGFIVAPNEVPAVVASSALRCGSLDLFNRWQLIQVAERRAQRLPVHASASSPELYMLWKSDFEATHDDDASTDTSVVRERPLGRYLRPMAPQLASALLEQFPTVVDHTGINERVNAAGEVPPPISSHAFMTEGSMRRLGLRPVDGAPPLIVDDKGRLRASIVKLYRLADTRDVAGDDTTSISEEELKAIPVVRAARPMRALHLGTAGAAPRFPSGRPLSMSMAALVDPAGHPREAELRSFTSTTWYTRRDLKRLGLQPNPYAVPFLVPKLPAQRNNSNPNNGDAPPTEMKRFELFNEAQLALASEAAMANAWLDAQADLPTATDEMDAHGAVSVQQNKHDPQDELSESDPSCDSDDANVLDDPPVHPSDPGYDAAVASRLLCMSDLPSGDELDALPTPVGRVCCQ